MIVIETAKSPGKRESVLRKISRLRGISTLHNDLVELLRQHHQRPDFRSAFAGQHLRNSPLQGAVAGYLIINVSDATTVSSGSLRKIELVRTAAYWQYGPVSPSNESASLKSKAITVLRVNLSRKYR